MADVQQRRKWYHIKWFSDDDTKEERRLILKLDLLIVPYAVLAYWTKYTDQANINNAYVSGVQTDLDLHGNELVQLQTMYTLGAVLGQIPFAYLFTKFPMSWLIPFLDIAWGIFTLLQYRVTSYSELAAYRFLVGWFEAAFFPSLVSRRRNCPSRRRLLCRTHTRYTDRKSYRSRCFIKIDDVNGLAGWRWMYIICAIITIPIGILGYFILPGTPDKPNKFILKNHDIEVAQSRLKRAGHGIAGTFKWKTLIDILRNWKFWAFLWLDIFFWNGCYNTNAGGYLLWLKSLDRYSTSKVNELNAISPALGNFYTLFICFASDLVLGPAWAITVAHTWDIVGLTILVVWKVPESALWFAFATTYSSVAMSSVLYGWVNSELRYSPIARAVVLVTTTVIAQSTTIWTPLLVFKTVEGPRFTKGYSFVLANAICLILTAHLIRYFTTREGKRRNSEIEGQGSVGSGEGAQDPEAVNYTVHPK